MIGEFNRSILNMALPGGYIGMKLWCEFGRQADLLDVLPK
jgi:hypothetical protein